MHCRTRAGMTNVLQNKSRYENVLQNKSRHDKCTAEQEQI